jgi:predicted transcriptional regulator
MKAVWKRNPITVKEVQIAIRPARPLAYTTVMTVMHRLFLKGFLLRARLSRTDYYEPAVEFSDVRDAAVSGVINHFFKGSRDEFLHFLGSDAEPPEAVGVTAVPAALDETLL